MLFRLEGKAGKDGGAMTSCHCFQFIFKGENYVFYSLTLKLVKMST
jgi:hypothetical protein